MNTPTLYLDGLILAAAAYPSAFGHSLFAARRRPALGASPAFLACLAVPYAAVALAASWLRPDLFVVRWAPIPALAAALAVAPFALGLEFAAHAVPVYRATGRWPRRITLHGFWA